MHVSAALLVGLLSPAAAILSVADEKTALTGFDLGEFMSGVMHGATGEESDQYKQCTELALSLNGLKDSVTKLQNMSTILDGMKGFIDVFQAAGPKFEACKGGIQSTVQVAKAMYEHRPETFAASAQSLAKPASHFPEIMKLAGGAATALKEGSYKDAGESMGQILRVAGLVSTPEDREGDPEAPPASSPAVGAPASSPAAGPPSKKSMGLFGLFKPKREASPASSPAVGPPSKKSRGLFGLFKPKPPTTEPDTAAPDAGGDVE